MSLFGDFYNKPIKYNRNKKEQDVTNSEDWSAVILSGSSDLVTRELPINRYIYPLLFLVLLIASGILVWRLFNLQVVQGQHHALLASGNSIRTTVIPAPRGAIYDRNGVLLARNTAQFDLVVSPSKLPVDRVERAKVASALASLTSSNVDEFRDKLDRAQLSQQAEVVIKEKIEREMALNIEERIRDFSGVSVESTPQREYLDEGRLAHVLGYIGRISAEEWQEHPEYRQVDVIGKSGIEKSYEPYLRGLAGREQVEVDASGRPIRFLARVEPQAGKNINLSIDWGLQQALFEAVKKQVEASGSKAGSAVAIDPQTGELLAAVNYPTYDTNLFAKGISQADYDRLLNDDSRPLLNRVTSGNYPVGSVIKPFISIGALEENIINSQTTIIDKGKLEVPNIYDPSIVYTFKGWKLEGLGAVNVVRALEWSSDVFFYQVGGGYQSFQGLGERRLLDWYAKFGFGSKTGVDINEESAGFLPSPEHKKRVSGEPWYIGDTYNISIGQGDLRATPLQMAVSTASIANGGKIIKPRFVHSRAESLDMAMVSPVEILKGNFITPKNIQLVQDGMVAVVESGTACCSLKGEVPVRVAGKTGTAETSSEGFDGKNPRTKPHAWFTAYAPAQNPRIATVVMIENSGEGSVFAVPATADILRWYFTNR